MWEEAGAERMFLLAAWCEDRVEHMWQKQAVYSSLIINQTIDLILDVCFSTFFLSTCLVSICNYIITLYRVVHITDTNLKSN